MIARQVERLGQLVDELLDISRLTEGRLSFQLENVDLAEVGREVATRFHEEFVLAGSALVLHGLAHPVVGRWNRLRLEQVVISLLTNALKYGQGRPPGRLDLHGRAPPPAHAGAPALAALNGVTIRHPRREHGPGVISGVTVPGQGESVVGSPCYRASGHLEAFPLTEASCQARDVRKAGCLTSSPGPPVVPERPVPPLEGTGLKPISKELHIIREQRSSRGGSRDQRTNRRIRAREVRVVGSDGGQLGVMPLEAALDKARSEGLDLVEISPMASPPVCKIMDYGKFKYEEKKKASESRRAQVKVELKEVKLRPKTEEHDYEFKVRNMRRFLEDGNKAKVVIQFRGREITHKQQGTAILEDVANDLKDVGVVEQPPRMEGRLMFMIIAPTAKIAQRAREQARQAAQAKRAQSADKPAAASEAPEAAATAPEEQPATP